MHERLPHNPLTEHKGDNHLAINSHLEAIITELVPGGGEKAVKSQQQGMVEISIISTYANGCS